MRDAEASTTDRFVKEQRPHQATNSIECVGVRRQPRCLYSLERRALSVYCPASHHTSCLLLRQLNYGQRARTLAGGSLALGPSQYHHRLHRRTSVAEIGIRHALRRFGAHSGRSALLQLLGHWHVQGYQENLDPVKPWIIDAGYVMTYYSLSHHYSRLLFPFPTRLLLS